MLSSGSVCYPLDRYVILCVRMLSSGSVCYPLDRYVVLCVRMLSSGSVCYPLDRYAVLCVRILSSGSVCYPLDRYCEGTRQFPNSFKNLFLTTNLTLNDSLLEPQFVCFISKKLSLFRASHFTVIRAGIYKEGRTFKVEP
jgi:hypothetical protein